MEGFVGRLETLKKSILEKNEKLINGEDINIYDIYTLAGRINNISYSYRTSRKFLAEIYRFCLENDIDKEITRFTLFGFIEKKSTDDLFLELAKTPLEGKYLKKFLDTYASVSSLPDLIRQEMDNPSGKNFSSFLLTLVSVMEWDITEYEVDHLIDYANDPDNSLDPIRRDNVVSALSNIFDKIDAYCPIPEWVSLGEGENKSLLDSVDTGLGYTYDAEKEDYVFDARIEGNMGFDLIEKIEKKDVGEFIKFAGDKDGDETDPEKLIQSFLDMQSDIITGNPADLRRLRNRVWGPENRRGQNCISSPQTKNDEPYGPCRMFLCECHEKEEDDYGGWFTGSCACCKKKIADPSHTVRFPMEQGGWKGCYCSFECIRDLSPYPLTSEVRMKLEMTRDILHDEGAMDRSVF